MKIVQIYNRSRRESLASEDPVNMMSPTQEGLVYTGKESQPSLIVFGSLMVGKKAPSFLSLRS